MARVWWTSTKTIQQLGLATPIECVPLVAQCQQLAMLTKSFLHDYRTSFLAQLKIRPPIAVECERPIRVDRDSELAYIFLLPSKSITHAIPSICNVWKRDCRGSLADRLRGALDFLVGDFHILVEIHRAIPREDQVHVQDKWYAPLVMTRECCRNGSCKREKDSERYCFHSSTVWGS